MAFTPVDMFLLLAVAAASALAGFCAGCRHMRRLLQASRSTPASSLACEVTAASTFGGASSFLQDVEGVVAAQAANVESGASQKSVASPSESQPLRPLEPTTSAPEPAPPQLEDTAVQREDGLPSAQGVAGAISHAGSTAPMSEGKREAGGMPPVDPPIAPLPPARKRTPKANPVAAPATREAVHSKQARERDDLQRIKGLGPRLEVRLNALGVTRLAQIADWTPDEALEMGKALSVPGRPLRENWVGQARRLASEPALLGRVDGPLPIGPAIESPAEALPQECGFLFPELAETPKARRNRRRELR